ncbi:MAG: ribosomal protein methyltransferase [Actinomycetota bacterium]
MSDERRVVHTVVIRTDAAGAELAADALRALGAAAVEERAGDRPAVVEIAAVLGEAGPDLDVLVGRLSTVWEVRVEAVDAEPAETWKAHSQSVRVGDWLVIRPAWIPPVGDDHGREQVVIDPGASFGLGDHPTTRLCAAALGRLVNHGDRVLDMGCGSGVLSVVACRRGAGRVTSVDIAPDAVTATLANASANGVADRVDVHLGSTVPEGPFDVVVANILAPALLELAPGLIEVVGRGGRLVLSGLLASRHAHVLEAYRGAPGAPTGLAHVGTDEIEGWCALEFRRDGAPSR